jgi:nickel-dependent lactate racemase
LKRLKIPYGREELPLEVPEANWGGLLRPPEPPVLDWNAGLQSALASAPDSESLTDFLAGCRSLLIVVNDETRPTPTGKVLEFLWPQIKDLNFKILVATGVHRKSSEAGCARMFGPLWPALKEKILFHESREERSMIFLGETLRGTRVLVNSAVMMADRLLAIGSVEPHYFSGFTGGRKMIVPGLAAYSTIVANHSLAMESGALPLRLLGNPVHEDLMEAAQYLTVPPIFSLQLVLTPTHELFGAFAGTLTRSFLDAALRAAEVFSIPFQEKADILIAVARPPLDLDLYQSQKPIEHGKLALKKDGILILVMPCRQGAGPADFQELLRQTGDPDKARLMVYQPYALGFHRVLRNVRFLQEGGAIWGVTDLDPGFLSQTFIRPKPGLQEALDQAIAEKGPRAKVNILMDAGLCVPNQQVFH